MLSEELLNIYDYPTGFNQIFDSDEVKVDSVIS